MSPDQVVMRTLTISFPRVSGDEPGKFANQANPPSFSPRERG